MSWRAPLPYSFAGAGDFRALLPNPIRACLADCWRAASLSFRMNPDGTHHESIREGRAFASASPRHPLWPTTQSRRPTDPNFPEQFQHIDAPLRLCYVRV